MNIPIVSEVLGKVADKIWPDAEERQKNMIRIRELDQAGEFKELELQSANIQAEAKSDDPWTSRARPTFLYVMYVYLLMAMPIGLIAVFFAAQVTAAIGAAKLYLAAIPTEMWTLFGLGYLGYVKKRSDDKEVAAGMAPKKFLNLF